MKKTDYLLLRFGEVTLKGRNRARFEKAAVEHVRALLRPYPDAKIRREFGRIYVDPGSGSAEELIPVLQNVFGMTSLSPVRAVRPELDEIVKAAEELVEAMELTRETTFKTNVRRVWKDFPHSSQETNPLVASPLLKKFPLLKVDMHDPELELRVEIRDQAAYVFGEVIPGPGGFPLGTNGKALLLLSGGIDSPVAGWSSLRRGLEVECIHFHSYPFTSEQAKEKVIDLARVLAGYAGKVRLHIVPFTEVQTSFTRMGQDNLMITLMRRAMLRIATKVAEREKALALVTGESLGQVASQTLPSMNVIERATELPILRPLVMTDKEEIIRISRRIGTYDISVLPYEDCCTLFVPKSPTTNPNLRIVGKVEATTPNLTRLIEEAAANTETIELYAGDTRSPGAVSVNEDWF
ncbi:tRNA uracil 4-sulfurtransferase ThiI [Saccharibacillus sp. CPCC 101409]|uniref:tRNA uracil 4-sulfurtransferase ThiI n=1 Tax=Saccharibacillus sp. CPCC 101409 TaxID=3058041 RepID=UPI002673D0FF|nr:tRNA uracil 4-sulfurtransferase ThiI [Saccharibacillus sp. CPCC 101409]MDO3409188.1 tRNA uracil 4-sulfurtransferase ThiI [Saccharibacillus sp. CPCC 101409]